MKNLAKGTRVVRSKGDYVVGRTGLIIDIDPTKNRAQVDWDNAPKSWVAFASLEMENEPYQIMPHTYNERTGKHTYPKYQKL